MAYRFNGSSDKIFFDAAPLAGYTTGPITIACFFRRSVLGTFDDILGVYTSGSGIRSVLYANTSNQLAPFQGVNGTGGASIASTTIWYLAVLTIDSTNNPRIHLHNGTSWSHAANSSLASASIIAGDRIGVSANIAAGFMAADVVCGGIKKSDSSDAAVETLSRTSFQAWRDFGFDWLIGFDSSLESAGILQDQASPGTGDEISITGTSAVSDPAGWLWTDPVTTVDVPFILGATSVYAPTLGGTGTATFAVPFVSAATSVYAPTVTTFIYHLEIPHIPAATTLYRPTVGEPTPLAAPFIGATTSTYAPVLSHDGDPPRIMFARLQSANTIVLTYNEPLNTATVPLAGDYTVRVNGAAQPVAAVSVLGRKVTLTLA